MGGILWWIDKERGTVRHGCQRQDPLNVLEINHTPSGLTHRNAARQQQKLVCISLNVSHRWNLLQIILN